MSDINQLENLSSLIQKYNLQNFVETGCFEGNALKIAKDYKLKSFSCDINIFFVELCKNKFPEAIIKCSDSFLFLEKIIPTILNQTLFWLDAHLPSDYGITGKQEQIWPLYKELELIKKLKPNFQNDVIICDDMHAIPGNICFNIGFRNMDWLSTRPYDDYVNVLSDTHTATLVPVSTGMLVFTPKGT